MDGPCGVGSCGAPVEISDFTRGGWKAMKPLGIVNVDVAGMKFGNVESSDPQQAIGQGKEG